MKRIGVNTKKIEKASLLALGFCPTGDDIYEYIEPLGGINMTVKIIYRSDTLFGAVYDEYGEEYVLHNTASDGDFVNRVRNEYKKVEARVTSDLEKTGEPFDFEQSNRLAQYAKKKYGTSLDFPFGDGNGIARRADNGKWYFALLKITLDKLGIDSERPCEVVNLKLEPSVIEKRVDKRTIFPAYHMNKRHWVSVLLNGTLDDSDLFELVDMSYDLTK